MEMICTMLLCSAVILNSIGSGSQSQPPVQSTARVGSSSPTLSQTFSRVLGFKFEDLKFIRLRPNSNQNRVFELRRYVFPPNGLIGLRINNRALKPIPTEEQIVLSTSNGDVYAILGKTSGKHSILRAICKRVPGRIKRAKMNINSGAVVELTEEEIAECPVPTLGKISKHYGVSKVSSLSESSPDVNPNPGVHRFGHHLPPTHGRPPLNTSLCLATPNYSASSSTPAKPPLCDIPQSPALRKSFPRILGYKFEDLPSIRLSPYNHPHRIFQLQIYAFPTDEPIGIKTKNLVLIPMPSEEQIVMSEYNGDICAILLKSSSNHTFLRAIFTSIPEISGRVKINMNSRAIERMTTEEMEECPVIPKIAIKKSYRVFSS